MEINTGRNRGKRSEDDALFSPEDERCKLNHALEDMFYFLSKDYPMKSTLELVGNRYRLVGRQMLALQGMCCSSQDLHQRKTKELKAADLAGQEIYIDGFNFLILMESTLSGAYIFRGIDGCYRDISSVHGTYKRVNQTEDVLIDAGRILKQLGVKKVHWIFDSPVSNSGRLKAAAYEIAEQYDYPWEIQLELSPDKYLTANDYIVISSDAWILNNCYKWFNLGAHIINEISILKTVNAVVPY